MKNRIKKIIGLCIVVMISLGIVLWLGTQKCGFHEDEYYSYYSSNYTYGWMLTEGVWTDNTRLFEELTVQPEQGFQYGLVKMVQSWDVHPPVYYWVLHTICSFSEQTFSKWQGLGINIVIYLVSIMVFYKIAELLCDKKECLFITILTASYASSLGIISGVMFIRMYTLMTCILLISMYLHVNAWKQQKMTDLKTLICMGVVGYVGFLTQYYFLFYQFFITAACCVFLLLKNRTLKQSLIHGMNMVVWILLACLTYPAALGHMFRGYRGTEATKNLFDISNTFSRLTFFADITENYLFNIGIYGIGIIIVITVVHLTKQKKWNGTVSEEKNIYWILGIVVCGYFGVVSKSALMLGDSSVRYILPIFPVILLLLIPFYQYWRIQENKYIYRTICAVLAIMVTVNVYHITQKEVLFLYQEEKEWVDYAKEQEDATVIYIYDFNNQWCVWKSANELLEYPQIMFLSNASEIPIMDEEIKQAQELMVYINSFGNEQVQIQRIYESNSNVKAHKLVKEDKFCKLYVFRKE